MLTVHHLGISQSERIVWLCEELGIPYEYKRYDRDSVTRLAPAAYKALHPDGTAPVITDGNLVLPESGAIIEYIIAKYGNGKLTVGKDNPAFADHLFWLHYANASFMPNHMGGMFALMTGDKSDNPMLAMIDQRKANSYALAEKYLGRAPFFGGKDVSGADINMVFVLTTMRMFVPHDLSNSPNIRAYLQRIGARPAYQRAMAKAEPGMPPLLT
jgi:glutathione S-transferase